MNQIEGDKFNLLNLDFIFEIKYFIHRYMYTTDTIFAS